MHQGNWTCSGCGGTITELPFEPRGTAGLKCRDCHQKGRGGGGGSSGGNRQGGERKMFSGQWKCSACGGSITELPFEPRNPDTLTCNECYRKTRG